MFLGLVDLKAHAASWSVFDSVEPDRPSPGARRNVSAAHGKRVPDSRLVHYLKLLILRSCNHESIRVVELLILPESCQAIPRVMSVRRSTVAMVADCGSRASLSPSIVLAARNQGATARADSRREAERIRSLCEILRAGALADERQNAAGLAATRRQRPSNRRNHWRVR